jgi:hypothetical protein
MKGTARLQQVLPPREPIRFPSGLFALLRSASAPTVRMALSALAINWMPIAILAAFGGVYSLRAFLTDYAAQSRLLVVIPLLIIAEPPFAANLQSVADKFRDDGIVKPEQRARFDSAEAVLVRRGNNFIVKVVVVILAYVFVASTFSTIASSPLMPWCFGAGGVMNLSPAGSWYVLVSTPIVLALLFLWIWRQLVWFWFLGVTSRMDLQLIASHPDRAGGLIFVEQCMWGYLRLSFAIGTIVAGGVANRVVHLHQRIEDFRYIPLVVIAVVVILCAGPFCVFWELLRRTRRRGIFAYGSLATSMGRQFEHKWLATPTSPSDDALAKTDFSAMIDLYSVVANVHEIKSLPIGMRNIGRLVGAALAPAVPLAFIALPFDVIMQHLIKLLL